MRSPPTVVFRLGILIGVLVWSTNVSRSPTPTACRRSTNSSSTTTRPTPTLLEGNEDVDQKLVMSHVFGHVDFFKHNFLVQSHQSAHARPMANHATRVRRYQDLYRHNERVEEFIDVCLSSRTSSTIHVHIDRSRKAGGEGEGDLPG